MAFFISFGSNVFESLLNFDILSSCLTLKLLSMFLYNLFLSSILNRMQDWHLDGFSDLLDFKCELEWLLASMML